MLKPFTSSRISATTGVPAHDLGSLAESVNSDLGTRRPRSRMAGLSVRAAYETVVTNGLGGGIIWPGTIWVAVLLLIVK